MPLETGKRMQQEGEERNAKSHLPEEDDGKKAAYESDPANTDTYEEHLKKVQANSQKRYYSGTGIQFNAFNGKYAVRQNGRPISEHDTEEEAHKKYAMLTGWKGIPSNDDYLDNMSTGENPLATQPSGPKDGSHGGNAKALPTEGEGVYHCADAMPTGRQPANARALPQDGSKGNARALPSDGKLGDPRDRKKQI